MNAPSKLLRNHKSATFSLSYGKTNFTHVICNSVIAHWVIHVFNLTQYRDLLEGIYMVVMTADIWFDVLAGLVSLSNSSPQKQLLAVLSHPSPRAQEGMSL